MDAWAVYLLVLDLFYKTNMKIKHLGSVEIIKDPF